MWTTPRHLRGLLRRDAEPSLHKAGCFAHEHPGAVAVFTIASGSEPVVKALERRIIRSVAPDANTTFSARGPWRQPPQIEAVRVSPPAETSQDGEPHDGRGLDLHLWGTRHGSQAAHGEGQTTRTRAVSRHVQEMSYEDACHKVQSEAPAEDNGPFHLFAEPMYSLLVSWICTRTSNVDWLGVFRHRGRPLLYKLGLSIMRLRRPCRRLTGMRLWRHASHLLGELPWHVPVLRMPHDADGAHKHAVMATLRRSLSAGCAWRESWLRERMRPVSDKAETVASQRYSMCTVPRNMIVEELFRSHPSRAALAASGADLQRIKLRTPGKIWEAATVIAPVARRTAGTDTHQDGGPTVDDGAVPPHAAARGRRAVQGLVRETASASSRPGRGHRGQRRRIGVVVRPMGVPMAVLAMPHRRRSLGGHILDLGTDR